MIPYGRQHVSEADIEAVSAVLRSDFLTQGPQLPAFEDALRARCESSYAVAANSATSALHVACLALGLGPGGRLWTSPITFVASANVARLAGADVDFVDINPRTYNMCADALAVKLRAAESRGELPDIVMPVHLAGQSCEMAAIHELGKRYGFKIVEDASHAVGGSYRGEPVGSCRFSDVTVFSFHPVKIITTAEGGAALTNDDAVAQKMRRLVSHGVTRDEALMTEEVDGPWSYQQIELGLNYRMTDVHAALGLSQLSRLDEIVSRRHEMAARYDDELTGLPITLPYQLPEARSALHLYPIVCDTGAVDRRAVFEAMRAAGVYVNVHYIPVYKQPYYRALGFSADYCRTAELYYAGALTIPLFPTLTDAQQDEVIVALKKALEDGATPRRTGAA